MENQVSSMNINDKKYLTKFNIASFALAGFGQNLIIGVVNSFILFFYTDVYLLGAGAAGILMIVARVWDALNDPIMGTIVDKTKTQAGQDETLLNGHSYTLGTVYHIAFLDSRY